MQGQEQRRQHRQHRERERRAAVAEHASRTARRRRACSNATQTLAVELAPKVRVNAVVVGLVVTEQAHLFYGDEEGIAAVGATVPLGRMADPTDVADVCLFLASPLARYVTGAQVLVHGGGELPSYMDAAKGTVDMMTLVGFGGQGRAGDRRGVGDRRRVRAAVRATRARASPASTSPCPTRIRATRSSTADVRDAGAVDAARRRHRRAARPRSTCW